MGHRGPQPTPTPILQARGSWRAGERSGEIQFETKAPTCPAWLSPEAKAEWRRQMKQLTLAGLVQSVDRSAMAVYCEAWGEFVLAVDQIQQRTARGEIGLDVCVKLIRLKNAAAERVIRLADRFGFSPAARARIKSPPREEGKPSGKARFFAG